MLPEILHGACPETLHGVYPEPVVRSFATLRMTGREGFRVTIEGFRMTGLRVILSRAKNLGHVMRCITSLEVKRYQN